LPVLVARDFFKIFFIHADGLVVSSVFEIRFPSSLSSLSAWVHHDHLLVGDDGAVAVAVFAWHSATQKERPDSAGPSAWPSGTFQRLAELVALLVIMRA